MLCSFEEEPVVPPPDETANQAYDRRRKLLNNNQVQAAAYFVRRVNAFMKHIVKRKNVLGGTLKDYVIRYETQGRGSVHAHMLWWVDLDPDYQNEDDEINLPEELEREFHLVVTDVATQKTSRVYDKLLLDYTNGNIWALKELRAIEKKLRIVDGDAEDMM